MADVSLERDGDIAVVTLGTGDRRNALGTADWLALGDTFLGLHGDEALRVVVVRGAGEYFSSGSDMREWLEVDVDHVDASFAAMERALQAIEATPVPVVAEIRGIAAGAGCQVALACDIRVMARSAKIGMPIARLGILASPAFAARLIAAAGPALARDLLYTGMLLKAETALRCGLTSLCVDDDALADATQRMVERIASQPPQAIRAAKRAVSEVIDPLRALSAENPNDHAVAFDEFKQGISKFLAR